MREKVLPVLLSAALVIGLFPGAAIAGDAGPANPLPDNLLAGMSHNIGASDIDSLSHVNSGAISGSSDEAAFDIVADGADSITVVEPVVSDVGQDVEGDGSVLALSASKQKIQRDYSQVIKIRVANGSTSPVSYFLKCSNPYDDIYMNFVEGGSKGAPLAIQPGEAQIVDLSVFAQNAERTAYTINVSAFVVGETNADGGDEEEGDGSDEEASEPDVSMSITFDCDEADGKIRLKRTGQSATTLAIDYSVTNVGAEKITDVTAFLQGEAADYARIAPTLENYELEVGQVVSFRVVPDLAKMKEDRKGKVVGLLAMTGGARARAPLSFDVEGEDVTTANMGELALVQDGNPYADMEFDDDSLVIRTAAGGSPQDFGAITAKYFDPSDPAKDGVNTVDEYREVLETLIDDEGLINFEIEDEIGYGGGKSAKVSMAISAEFVEAAPVVRGTHAQAAASAGDSQSTTRLDGDGNVVTTTTYTITFDEYMKVLEKVNGAAGKLNLAGADNLTLQALGFDTSANEGRKVVIKVVDKIEGAALGFPKSFEHISMDTWLTERHLRETYSGYNKFTQSAIVQGGKYATYAKALGNVTSGISTGVDVYKTAKVWSNPKASGGQKFGYAGLQTAKIVNRYFGGKALSKLGAYIGTAIGDGLGAVVGYFSGHVVSGLIDYGLSKWADSIAEGLEDEGGSALYYDIYGHQCTNAGQVKSSFYLPDYTSKAGDSGESDDDGGFALFETGRMYDGTDGDNYYVDDARVGYEYFINGSPDPVATSANDGLTQVTTVDLSGGREALHPGMNTIVRDYDTNPGTHYVTADSEITVIYPSDTEVSYIGHPEETEEVRRLPDFAVYRENITVDGEAIAGQSSRLSAYVYNRGSLGGWVDIEVSEGSRLLKSERDVYMPAFSERKVDLDWVPSSAGEATVNVKLINRSQAIDERKLDNNEASHTFKVRKREVPQIGTILPQEAYVEDAGTLYASAEITSIADLVSGGVSMFVDDRPLSDVSVVKRGESVVQASARVGDLAVGRHILKVVAQYSSGDGFEVVERMQELVMKGWPVVRFSVDATIANPSFYLVDKSSGVCSSVSASLEPMSTGNVCTFRKPAGVEGDEASYSILVKSDGGLLVTDVDGLEGRILSLDSSRSLGVNCDLEGVRVTGVQLRNVVLEGGVKLRGYYSSWFTGSDVAVSGIEQADVSITYSGAGLRTWRTINRSEVGLSSGATINLSDFVRVYQIAVDLSNVGSGGDDDYDDDYDDDDDDDDYDELDLWLEGLITVDGEPLGSGESWYGYDDDGATGTFVIDDEAVLSSLDSSHELTAYLFDEWEGVVFRASLNDYSAPIVLDFADNRQVAYRLPSDADEGRDLDDVETYIEVDGYEFDLYGTVLSLPPGVYDAEVYYSVGAERLEADRVLDVSRSDAVVTLEKPSASPNPPDDPPEEAMGALSVSWPDSLGYDEASVRLYYDEGSASWKSATIANGDAVEMPVGAGIAYVTLRAKSDESDDDYDYDYDQGASFSMAVTISEGDEFGIEVGMQYSGSADAWTEAAVSGGMFYAELSDLTGADDLRLSSLRRDTPLKCEVIYTAVDDDNQKFASAFELSELEADEYIRVPVPSNIEPGEYSYRIHLTSGELAEENVFYRIRTVVEGRGSVTPKGTSVRAGQAKRIAFMPDDGYEVEDVAVDGESLGPLSAYSFDDVSEDHLVNVSFTAKPLLTNVKLDKRSLIYNAQTQKVLVREVKSGSQVVPSSEYTVSGGSAKAAGIYVVKVTAKKGSHYAGSATAEFTVSPASVSSVTLKASSATYDTKAHKPAVKAVKAGSLTVPSSGYKVEYLRSGKATTDFKSAGSITVKVTGKDNFTRAKTATFKINQAANPMKASAVAKSVKLPKGKKTLAKAATVSGAVKLAKKAVGTVTYAKVAKGSAKCLSINKNTGKVTVAKGTKAGTYKLKATVKAAGNKNYKAKTQTLTLTVRVVK